MPDLTKEQMDTRACKIGSSQIAAIVGLSPWASEHDVWLDIMGHGEQKSGMHLELGHVLEPAIGALAARELGLSVTPCASTYELGDFGVATPDFLVHVKGEVFHDVLEIKNIGPTSAHQWRDGVPEHVKCQVHWQLLATHGTRGYVGALVCGSDLRTYTLPYDRDLAEWLLDCGKAWHAQYIVGGEEPPICGGDTSKAWIEAQAAAMGDGDAIVPSPDAEQLVDDLIRWKAAYSEIDGKIKIAQNRLRQIIGHNAGVSTSHGVTTWRRSKDRTSTSWEEVAYLIRHHVSDSAWREAVSSATSTKPGYRSLRLPKP